MGKKLIILTLGGCPHCVSLKSTLNDLKIDAQFLDVDENQELWNEIVDETGLDYLPAIMMVDDDTDNVDIAFPTVHFQSENEGVDIIKEFIR